MCPESEEEKELMNKIPYASAVGSNMYSMVCTRPDLSFTSSLINRFKANLGRGHWNAVKWALRYIKGTTSFGLMYKRSDQDGDQLTYWVLFYSLWECGELEVIPIVSGCFVHYRS